MGDLPSQLAKAPVMGDCRLKVADNRMHRCLDVNPTEPRVVGFVGVFAQKDSLGNISAVRLMLGPYLGSQVSHSLDA